MTRPYGQTSVKAGADAHRDDPAPSAELPGPTRPLALGGLALGPSPAVTAGDGSVLQALRRMAQRQPTPPEHVVAGNGPLGSAPAAVIRRKSDQKLHDRISVGSALILSPQQQDPIAWAWQREKGRIGAGPDAELAAIMQRIVAYDASKDGRPATQRAALDAIMQLLAGYFPPDFDNFQDYERAHLRSVKTAVQAEQAIVAAQAARLDAVTDGPDAPYQMMTAEGALWKEGAWEHSATALGMTGKAYFEELSTRNMAAMTAEVEPVSGQEWVASVRGRLVKTLREAVLNHYTPLSRARQMLTGNVVKAKTVLEKEEPSYRHNTSPYDDHGLANSGFVFFFIEAPGSPFRESRFAQGAQGEDSVAARISVGIEESGLLANGWVMLSDFAQREYPTIVSKPDAPAEVKSHLPTRPAPVGYTTPLRSFQQGLSMMDPDQMEALHDEIPDAGKRQAVSTVRMQASGDAESELRYGSGAALRTFADRMFQNVLVGPDIIAGLAERAVVEIARIAQVNPPAAAKILTLDGAQLLKFLLKDLIRPQAMVPNSVAIAEENIQTKAG